eukprot:g2473.t1
MIVQSAEKPQGSALVGCCVQIWWNGDAKFLQGKIVAYETSTNSYTIRYDNGEMTNGISLRKYEVRVTDSGAEWVIATETDNLEMTAADTITQLANSRLPQQKDVFSVCLKYEDLERKNMMKPTVSSFQSIVAEMLATLNKTNERYQKELSCFKEMFYTMRGSQDHTQNELKTLGELIDRVERGAMDIGVFSNTIDEECGIDRLHRFCFEGFVQSTRLFEQQVESLIKHSLHLSEQMTWLVPDFIRKRFQEIICATQYDLNDNSSLPCALSNVKKRFQQLHDLLNSL